MLRLILLLGIILVIAFEFVLLFDVGFGKSLPMSYMTISFILLFTSMVFNITVVKYTIVAFILSLFVVMILKRKITIERMKSLIKPSVLLFAALFIYLYFLLRNVGLTNIDDTYHWSQIVKGCLKTNEIVSIYQYTSSYPMFTALIEVFFCKMLGGYNDSYVILALSSFSSSFLFVLLDKYDFSIKGTIRSIILFVGNILILLCVNLSAYQKIFIFNSIYVDWIMSILFAYGAYLIYRFEDTAFDYISIVCVFSALTLIKPISIILFLMLCVTYFVYKLYAKKKLTRKDIVLIVIPFIVYGIWNIYSKNIINGSTYETVINAASSITNSSIVSVTSEVQNVIVPVSEKTMILKRFVSSYFSLPIINHPIKISYFALSVIFSLLFIVIGIAFKKKKEYYCLILMIFICSLGYAFSILLSYLFVFKDIEATTLVMYTRYMQTFSFAYLLTLYYVMNDNLQERNMEWLSLVFAVLFVEPESTSSILISSEGRYFNKQNEIKKIEKFVQDEYNGENLIIVSQTDMVYRASIEGIFTYESKKDHVTMFSSTKETDYSLEYVLDLFSNSEYILIGDYDDYFYDNYWSKITDLPLYNSTLYRVVKDGESISFEYVYVWEE